jgi:hypothetical protein
VTHRSLRRSVALAVTAIACASGVAGASAPVRTVRANLLASDRDPRVRIRVPVSAIYAGQDAWILFGIAHCQLFAFVQADPHKNVQRLYWVQFEGYLPSMPRLHHEYTSTRHATLGGMNFYVDTWVQTNRPGGPPAPDVKPLEAFLREKGYAVPSGIHSGSDEQHIDALIAAKGYRLPRDMMAVRLVHLLDTQKRNELMIIYGEDLASTHLSATELDEGGKARNQWPTLEKALIRRALENVAVEPWQ